MHKIFSNMYSKILIFFILLSCLGQMAQAQQEVQFSQYVFNGLAVNPAYAGYRGDTHLGASFRKQWTSLPGAPQTGAVSIDGAPSWANDETVGLGAQVLWDKQGPQEYLSFTGSYAYRIRLDEEGVSRLCLGIGASLSQYAVKGDMISVLDENDPNVPVGKVSTFQPDASFGVYYYNPHFYAGVSVMQLFTRELNNRIIIAGVDKEFLTIRKTKHMYFTAGGLLNLSGDVKLKPSIMIKDDFNGPTSLDFNLFALLSEKLWIGGSYRTAVNIWDHNNLKSGLTKTNAASAMIEYFATDRLRIGYAYDVMTNRLSGYQGGSHEISIGFLIPNRKMKERIISPRYF
ncbi:hypothetical protein DF182_19035 [Chitinophaga flava]|uniref:Type IX secretion system membrane protein PorP/SprF n=2 Tax=Chitinophaga flava TaxID=2259036 RepID=A0A365XSU3_9BACT|nr:hypothetical protein DF182_19035 [Chitinophaga flava]